MRAGRSLLAVTSSLVWPAAVVAIPLGITFSAARVFAEAGVAPPPLCTDAKVTACADAGPMQACTCAAGGACACTSARCSSGSGVNDALVCEPVASSCSTYSLEPCAGKEPGASCEQTDTGDSRVASGTCETLSTGCLELNDAGVYQTTNPLACRATLRGPDAGPAASDDASADSGCSTSARARGGATLLAIPIALGLALASRRRRRR